MSVNGVTSGAANAYDLYAANHAHPDRLCRTHQRRWQRATERNILAFGNQDLHAEYESGEQVKGRR